MNFHVNLKTELIYKNLSLKDLSRLTKLPYATILSYVDQRKTIPRADAAIKIANVLNTTVEFLMTGKQPDSSKLVRHYPTMEELKSLPPEIQQPITNLIHGLSENFKNL